jgi:hypothetical protein
MWANVKLATDACVLLAVLAISILPAREENQAHRTNFEINKPQRISRTSGSTVLMPTASPCETTAKKEITITCEYTATPRSASKDINAPRIVLNRIVLSFEPKEESHMLVELTFANGGTTPFLDFRTSYLSIDNDAGQNYLRRVLPQVDFRKLAPGQRLTFLDRLLVGAFPPGHYSIYLWIPNPDPALKFDPARNFLLSSVGVADPATGLNKLATFTVVR